MNESTGALKSCDVVRLERLKSGFDAFPVRLEERRQRQTFAEMLRIFIGGEAGPIGCDLEEDAVRFAEVN
jgi:hypothetical protein